MCAVCHEAFCWTDIQQGASEDGCNRVESHSHGTNWRAKRSREIPRAELIKAAFRACDVYKDGFLCCAELGSFACKTGFDGAEDDWSEEYAAVCEEWYCDQAKGLAEQVFAELVNDHSEKGCPCTDEELRHVIALMRQKRQSSRLSPQRWLSSSFAMSSSTVV